jgi:DNA invertase Pin-like site-specific DNA recombinase
MARLARNLDDLLRVIQNQIQRGARVALVREGLTLTGDDSAMAAPMVSALGSFAGFVRRLLRERQPEGLVRARQRGACRGRRKALSAEQAAVLRHRGAAGEVRADVARGLGTRRGIFCQHLKRP